MFVLRDDFRFFLAPSRHTADMVAVGVSKNNRFHGASILRLQKPLVATRIHYQRGVDDDIARRRNNHIGITKARRLKNIVAYLYCLSLIPAYQPRIKHRIALCQR